MMRDGNRELGSEQGRPKWKTSDGRFHGIGLAGTASVLVASSRRLLALACAAACVGSCSLTKAEKPSQNPAPAANAPPSIAKVEAEAGGNRRVITFAETRNVAAERTVED